MGQSLMGQSVTGQSVMGQNVMGQNVTGQNVTGQNVTTPLRFTLDSTILVYAADASEPVRQATAIDIVARAATRDCRLTPQALAEFFHATTRSRIVPRAEAASQVRAWTLAFPIT